MARPKKGTKNIDGKWIFSDFSKGLYLLNTPRNIGEQLFSLAMISGRNCWSEKGALVTQNGYIVKGQIPEEDTITGYTRTTDGMNNIFLLTQSGNVYLYTASEGLKQYKTKGSPSSKPILCRRGKDLIYRVGTSNYLFGGFYDGSEGVTICSATFTAEGTYYQAELPLEQLPYFWSSKDVEIGSKQFTVISCVQEYNKTTATLKVVGADTSSTITTGSSVDILEKCSLPINFVFKFENEEPDVTDTDSDSDTDVDPTADLTKKDITIDPIMMECSQNRLFLLDRSGRIYYSQLGVVDNFEESAGAGYFEGFYNDYSQTLAIEDFLSGTLIVKQGGFYYLTISSSSTATGSAIFTVDIQKISNAGQEYASDHVIVGEKVFAYDTNTGAIVNAVATNVFGSLVSGKPIISSEYLNARSLGINDVKRCLTYNAESEVFILYYGENLSNGLVLTNIGTLFPRQLDKEIMGYVGFNQGVLSIGKFGELCQDFIKGTIVPNIKPEVEFEAIGVRDNRLICSSILEITELNGIDYEVTTRNAGASYNSVTPTINEGAINLPPFLYSDYKNNMIYDSFSLDTQWATLKSNVTRLACPMSGREGVSISMTFPENSTFCLSALRLPDFSQGE